MITRPLRMSGSYRFRQTMFYAITPAEAGVMADNSQNTGYRHSPV